MGLNKVAVVEQLLSTVATVWQLCLACSRGTKPVTREAQSGGTEMPFWFSYLPSFKTMLLKMEEQYPWMESTFGLDRDKQKRPLA